MFKGFFSVLGLLELEVEHGHFLDVIQLGLDPPLNPLMVGDWFVLCWGVKSVIIARPGQHVGDSSLRYSVFFGKLGIGLACPFFGKEFCLIKSRSFSHSAPTLSTRVRAS